VVDFDAGIDDGDSDAFARTSFQSAPRFVQAEWTRIWS
jgi:hypothetical protein